MARSKQLYHVVFINSDGLHSEAYATEQEALNAAASAKAPAESSRPIIVRGDLIEWAVGAVRVKATPAAPRVPRKPRAKKGANGHSAAQEQVAE